MLLNGCIRICLFYDVGEAFDQEKLRLLVGPGGAQTQPDFPRHTPEYVRFENPPIVEPTEPLMLASGEKVTCWVKYYEYAIVEVQLEVPFEGTWESLREQTSRWMGAPDIEPESRAVMMRHLEKASAAIIKPRHEWFQERSCAAGKSFVLCDRFARGGIQCCAGLRPPGRICADHPDSRIYASAVAGIPLLRQFYDARAGGCLLQPGPEEQCVLLALGAATPSKPAEYNSSGSHGLDGARGQRHQVRERQLLRAGLSHGGNTRGSPGIPGVSREEAGDGRGTVCVHDGAVQRDTDVPAGGGYHGVVPFGRFAAAPREVIFAAA